MLQARQSSSLHGISQQTPSAQFPDLHSAAAPQEVPFELPWTSATLSGLATSFEPSCSPLSGVDMASGRVRVPLEQATAAATYADNATIPKMPLLVLVDIEDLTISGTGSSLRLTVPAGQVYRASTARSHRNSSPSQPPELLVEWPRPRPWPLLRPCAKLPSIRAQGPTRVPP